MLSFRNKSFFVLKINKGLIAIYLNLTRSKSIIKKYNLIISGPKQSKKIPKLENLQKSRHKFIDNQKKTLSQSPRRHVLTLN